MPELASTQVVPASVLLKRPYGLVPRYKVAGLLGSTVTCNPLRTSSEGECTTDQCCPASRLLKSAPLNVVAYSVAGFAGSNATCSTAAGRPEFAAVQLSPSSALLKTPSTEVAAYRIAGSFGWMTKLWIAKLVSLEPAAFQVWPASVLLKTPEPVPAQTIEGSLGLMTRAKTTTPAGRPELVRVQVCPSSKLSKMPRPQVPA